MIDQAVLGEHGGYAVALHGYLQFKKDPDIWIGLNGGGE